MGHVMQVKSTTDPKFGRHEQQADGQIVYAKHARFDHTIGLPERRPCPIQARRRARKPGFDPRGEIKQGQVRPPKAKSRA